LEVDWIVIGTVREPVSRSIARLQAQAPIEITGRDVKMLDIAGVEAALNSII
jgi:hypothetical protein